MKENWISVNDRLPPIDESDESYSIHVLISDGKNVGIGYHEFEYFAEDPSETLQYRSATWSDLTNLLDTCISGWAEVTHWMPLVNAPNRRKQ